MTKYVACTTQTNIKEQEKNGLMPDNLFASSSDSLAANALKLFV